ncbi:MAG TPA: hypothetical protein VLG40_01390 [Candidatus Saccharimonas sp.]|nr:hypothetical protein [Candidatus Saccharimonas sp.]
MKHTTAKQECLTIVHESAIDHIMALLVYAEVLGAEPATRQQAVEIAIDAKSLALKNRHYHLSIAADCFMLRLNAASLTNDQMYETLVEVHGQFMSWRVHVTPARAAKMAEEFDRLERFCDALAAWRTP